VQLLNVFLSQLSERRVKKQVEVDEFKSNVTICSNLLKILKSLILSLVNYKELPNEKELKTAMEYWLLADNELVQLNCLAMLEHVEILKNKLECK
jgi:hypothetical protein